LDRIEAKSADIDYAFKGWPIEEAEGRGSVSRRGDDRSRRDFSGG